MSDREQPRQRRAPPPRPQLPPRPSVPQTPASPYVRQGPNTGQRLMPPRPSMPGGTTPSARPAGSDTVQIPRIPRSEPPSHPKEPRRAPPSNGDSGERGDRGGGEWGNGPLGQALATVINQATRTAPLSQDRNAVTDAKALLHTVHVPDCNCPDMIMARCRHGFDRSCYVLEAPRSKASSSVVDVMPSDVTSLEAERKFLREFVLPLGLKQSDVRLRQCGLEGVSPCGKDFRNGCIAFVGPMQDLEAACTRFDWARADLLLGDSHGRKTSDLPSLLWAVPLQTLGTLRRHLTALVNEVMPGSLDMDGPPKPLRAKLTYPLALIVDSAEFWAKAQERGWLQDEETGLLIMLQDKGTFWQLGTFGGKRELGEGSKECAVRETEEESAGVLDIHGPQQEKEEGEGQGKEKGEEGEAQGAEAKEGLRYEDLEWTVADSMVVYLYHLTEGDDTWKPPMVTQHVATLQKLLDDKRRLLRALYPERERERRRVVDEPSKKEAPAEREAEGKKRPKRKRKKREKGEGKEEEKAKKAKGEGKKKEEEGKAEDGESDDGSMTTQWTSTQIDDGSGTQGARSRVKGLGKMVAKATRREARRKEREQAEEAGGGMGPPGQQEGPTSTDNTGSAGKAGDKKKRRRGERGGETSEQEDGAGREEGGAPLNRAAKRKMKRAKARARDRAAAEGGQAIGGAAAGGETS